MSTPVRDTATARQRVFDAAVTAIRDAYDDPRERREPLAAPLAAALTLGFTPRHLASTARVPGRWLIARLPQLGQRADAYAAEIHHLERELAAVRADRALDVWHQRNPLATRVSYDSEPKAVHPPATKVLLAETFRVSRPTIDVWLEDARTAVNDGRIQPCDRAWPVDETD